MPAPRSPARVAPACRHFGACGGCTALDVGIDEQLDRKRERIAAALQPWLDGVDVEIDPPPRVPRHVRQKVAYPVQPDTAGRSRLGLYERGSHQLVTIEQCQTQEPALTRLGYRAGRLIRKLGLEPWDERSGRGFVRALHARIMPGTGELLVGVTTTGGRFEAARELAEGLLAAAADLRGPSGRRLRPVGVVRSIHPDPGNALLGRHHVPLLGRDYQEDRVDGLCFRVGFGNFYQSHRYADALLYRPALELLGDVRAARVVDGYGGVGTFGIRLARAGAGEVEILESHPDACRDARHNAARNGLGGVAVRNEDFAEAATSPADVCVVDPPRKGLGPAGVARVLELGSGRLLYVSCSPRSLARDLEGLCRAGYAVGALRLADLFPHTDQVELLALLRR